MGSFELLLAIKKSRKKGAQAVGLAHNSLRPAGDQVGVDDGRDGGLLAANAADGEDALERHVGKGTGFAGGRSGGVGRLGGSNKPILEIAHVERLFRLGGLVDDGDVFGVIAVGGGDCVTVLPCNWQGRKDCNRARIGAFAVATQATDGCL